MPRLIPINTPDGCQYLESSDPGQWFSLEQLGATIPPEASALVVQSYSRSLRFCFKPDAIVEQGLPLAQESLLSLFEQTQLRALRVKDSVAIHVSLQFYRIA